jgi:hypothetical protein
MMSLSITVLVLSFLALTSASPLARRQSPGCSPVIIDPSLGVSIIGGNELEWQVNSMPGGPILSGPVSGMAEFKFIKVITSFNDLTAIA